MAPKLDTTGPKTSMGAVKKVAGGKVDSGNGNKIKK